MRETTGCSKNLTESALSGFCPSRGVEAWALLCAHGPRGGL